MRILVIGSGGREHALVWKLKQSPRVSEVFVAPGNGGTAREGAINVAVDAGDLDGLVELARKEKEARKKQKTIEIKEVRLSPNIDVNDMNTKANAARKFISKGDRVKVTLRFRGREMAHMHASKHVLDDFAELLSDVATVEKAPKMEGRSMTMFLTEKR